jgi:hypothetical protein
LYTSLRSLPAPNLICRNIDIFDKDYILVAGVFTFLIDLLLYI